METYKGINLADFELRRWHGTDNDPHKTGRFNLVQGLIDFCIDNIKPTDHILELGCCLGSSTGIFAHFAKKVTTVDIMFHPVALENISKYNNIEHIKASSLQLAKTHPINYDILYIDTIHEEDHVLKELESLVPLCTSNPKRIAGHDWSTPGVQQALLKFFNKEPKKTYEDDSFIYEF